MSMKIKEDSIVKLKTGEEGTILCAYTDGEHFYFENPENVYRDISIDEIESVVWEPK